MSLAATRAFENRTSHARGFTGEPSLDPPDDSDPELERIEDEVRAEFEDEVEMLGLGDDYPLLAAFFERDPLSLAQQASTILSRSYMDGHPHLTAFKAKVLLDRMDDYFSDMADTRRPA